MFHSSLVAFLLCIPTAKAFNSFFAPPKSAASISAPPPSKIEIESWLDDKLQYPEPPTFDILQKTIEFSKCKTFDEIAPYYDDEYVFRGSLIGPITNEDVKKAQQGFNILDAYPDLETRPFGYTVDPDNPYRCYYFERWEGTNTGNVQIIPSSDPMPPTNAKLKLPTHIMSLNWTPEGKIIYACLSSPLDRFEGNTKGNGAILGLLTGAGVNSGDASIGSASFRLQQRLANAFIGRSWSIEEEIPSWWKSKSRGADSNDM